MTQEKKYRAVGAGATQTEQSLNAKLQDFSRLQGMMLYNFMALKSTVVPFTNEVMELNRIGMNLDPKEAVADWTERQKSAMKFPQLVETFGKQLFGSARYEGEKLLAENTFFALNHIPVKPGVTRRASMFHIGGFIPYSDNIFRLLPGANFFDHFVANGIEVFEMKLKCDKARFNPHMLDLSIEAIVESVHEFSDIAFRQCGERMILEGYCGTGINTFSAYLADLEGMARKFKMILTFVSPLDARKCTIFEQVHQLLDFINPNASTVDGHTISSVLDTIQERNFEKTPMGALVHGWKNKEWAKIEKIEDLTLRQQSELAAWYWLSLQHGAYYPLSRDLYTFYSRLFSRGVTSEGILPYEHKGRTLCLKDLKKTGVKVLVFLGDKDHLVNWQTADVLPGILGDQCEVVVHEKTGHVAYIFNPNRWNKDDPRAFKPDILETIYRNVPVEAAAAKAPAKTPTKRTKPAPAKVEPVVAPEPAAKSVTKAAAKPVVKATVKAAIKPVATKAAPVPRPPAKSATAAAVAAQKTKAAKVAVTPAAKVASKPAAPAAKAAKPKTAVPTAPKVVARKPALPGSAAVAQPPVAKAPVRKKKPVA